MLASFPSGAPTHWLRSLGCGSSILAGACLKATYHSGVMILPARGQSRGPCALLGSTAEEALFSTLVWMSPHSPGNNAWVSGSFPLRSPRRESVRQFDGSAESEALVQLRHQQRAASESPHSWIALLFWPRGRLRGLEASEYVTNASPHGIDLSHHTNGFLGTRTPGLKAGFLSPPVVLAFLQGRNTGN